MDDVSNNHLELRLAAMQEASPDAGCLYHAITLTADDELNVTFGTHSQWVGWTEDGRHEIRKSRLVYSGFAELWKKLNLPYCFVHTADELIIFTLAGGNALVERELAEQMFPDLLGPHPSIPHGRMGYQAPELFDQSAFRRAPTPKVRMQIFNRDGRKCRICGRRPDENLDLVLHVHHIRPWEKGGLTDPSNLITLCHTCHSGLAPHQDLSLCDYIDPPGDDPIGRKPTEFIHLVANYRQSGAFRTAYEAESGQTKMTRSRKKRDNTK
ncbi:HNH endonuclease [Bradyrhizobium liaoningense]